VLEEVQAWTEDMSPEDAARVEEALELLENPYRRGEADPHPPGRGDARYGRPRPVGVSRWCHLRRVSMTPPKNPGTSWGA
jgi:hypothetical protein